MSLRLLKPASNLTFRRPTNAVATSPSSDLPIPTHFLCPISLDLMKDPVTLPTGITYDRQSIETWLEAGNLTCPLTNQPLSLPNGDAGIIPNHSIRRMIQEWCVAHRSLGVDRIPTPKTPITALQIAETLSTISAASRRNDAPLCADLVSKLRIWSKESERNRRCISSNGAADVIAAVFRKFPSEQILSALAGMLPLSEEARKQLASVESLESIVSVLKSGSLSGRLHAVLMVKEMAAADTDQAAQIARADGLVEEIVRLLMVPASLQATKASLIAAYYMAGSSEGVASRFAEQGIVSVILDMIVDAEKSLCEKGIVVLDGILSSEAGREKAAGNALAIPVLVKKMFRVSDVATEFAVSAIWKMCKKQRNGDAEKCLAEAATVGAFQKLLLLLQVGCSDGTKEKASEILRMLNGFRGRGECIESADFKGLKSHF